LAKEDLQVSWKNRNSRNRAARKSSFLLTNELERLSRFLSYILRHEPGKFSLSPNGDGYVPIDGLLDQIWKKDRWRRVTKQHIVEVVERSEKKRFEVISNKIRALYGHTFTTEIHYQSVTPPEYLFHGTARRNIEKIEQEGLLPMKRQYVHISTTREDAYEVGLRRDGNPVTLKISALKAHNQGIKFYKAGNLFLRRGFRENILRSSDAAS